MRSRHVVYSAGSDCLHLSLPPEVEDTNPQIRRITAAEIWRKAIHLLVLVLPASIYYLGRETSLQILVPITLFAILCDILRARSGTFRKIIDRLFGFMMRRSEWTPLGGPVILNGATWVLLSLTILVSIFPLAVAVAAFSIFVVADALAALVGLSMGKHEWSRTGKTIEGSVAFFVTGLVLALFLFKIAPLAATIAVAVGTIVEAQTDFLNDNFVAPLAISTAIWAVSVLL